jgi:hypothetical protein
VPHRLFVLPLLLRWPFSKLQVATVLSWCLLAELHVFLVFVFASALCMV